MHVCMCMYSMSLWQDTVMIDHNKNCEKYDPLNDELYLLGGVAVLLYLCILHIHPQYTVIRIDLAYKFFVLEIFV